MGQHQAVFATGPHHQVWPANGYAAHIWTLMSAVAMADSVENSGNVYSRGWAASATNPACGSRLKPASGTSGATLSNDLPIQVSLAIPRWAVGHTFEFILVGPTSSGSNGLVGASDIVAHSSVIQMLTDNGNVSVSGQGFNQQLGGATSYTVVVLDKTLAQVGGAVSFTTEAIGCSGLEPPRSIPTLPSGPVPRGPPPVASFAAALPGSTINPPYRSNPDMTAPCQVPWGDFGSGPWTARVQAAAGAPRGLPGA